MRTQEDFTDFLKQMVRNGTIQFEKSKESKGQLRHYNCRCTVKVIKK